MTQLDFEIMGADLQMVQIRLRQGQGVIAEPGAMVSMQETVSMETSTSGGLIKGFRRMLGGGGLFLSRFENNSQSDVAEIAFSATYPGRVMAIDLERHGGEFIAQKNCFLCAEKSASVDITFTKRFSSGLFGGEGFILQKISGNNTAFIHGGGHVYQRELTASDSLMVDTGCLVGFESSVGYEVKLISGVSNMLFGGEGMFLVKLTGPGKVYIQSMPFARLVHSVAAMLPDQRSG